MRTEFARLLKQVRGAHPDADDDLLRRAYRVADKAHQSQRRLSGDPYITHGLAVASILAGTGLDIRTICAGLLHDVLEDTPVTYDELKSEFGEDIARLVDGVTKIGIIHAPEPTGPAVADDVKQAENLRKMLIATAKDVRVVLIKLADRLHNMRTIEFLPKHKVQRISQETLDIYAPIANRLGLMQWQWELEDHAFHHLQPETYKEIARAIAMRRKERERMLEDLMKFLEERLREAEVDARVIGRPKHLYGIYQKMERQGKTFEDVTDILAVRIIAPTISGCYNALGVIHHLWPPVAGRFKDYIAAPKMNMYQSIHTTVRLDGGRPLEVQIRTEEMDRHSRDGIAAHWKYKEGIQRADENTESQLYWLRQMYDWLKDANAPEELFESVRREISTSAVYVYTPKGKVIELPLGATPIDFAYMIHTHLGHTCTGAKVNGVMVPLRYHLQNGDIVEVLTSKSQRPRNDWLEFVVTGRARTRIRQKLRELDELPQVSGPGESRSVAPPQIAPVRPPAEPMDEAAREKLVRIGGARDMAMQFGKCCNAMPGDGIIGFVTRRHLVTIHRSDCRFLEAAEREPERLIPATWVGDEPAAFGVRVMMGARPNGLVDLMNAMRPMNLDISRADFRTEDDGMSMLECVFSSSDPFQHDRVMKALRQVAGVRRVDEMPADEPAQIG